MNINSTNLDIFEVIELAKTSEWGLVWYSDKGPILVTNEGDLKPIKLQDLPKFEENG